MRIVTTPLNELVDFYNGKAPEIAEDGEYVVYGSNGPIGKSKEFNHEEAIILGRVGAYCGSVEVCHNKFWASDNTIVVKARNDNDLRYLYYRLLSSPLRNFAGGAAHPLLTHTILRGIKLKVEADIASQFKIGSTLSAYDNLIENNRRRMELLEQAARLLYKEWFVSLRFPGHEHVKIKDGIPEGWKKLTIGEASSFLKRGITPRYDEKAKGLVINQKCIRNRLVNMSLARRQSKEVPLPKMVQHGDVLINSTGQGTLGRVAQFLDQIENCTVDSHITIARPAEGIPKHYFGFRISSEEDYLATMGRGATNQTELSKDTIADIPLIIPPKSIVEDFELTVGNICRQIQILTSQNFKLAKARDLLLPRLMNGELAV